MMLTIDDITTVFRSFMMEHPIALTDAYTGQVNRVSMPNEQFAIITPLFFKRLSTGRDIDNDTGTTATSSMVTLVTRTLDIQVDFYGDGVSAQAASFETLFRSNYGYDRFLELNPNVAPLYCSDIRQTSFPSGEVQWQERYTITATIQPRIEITVPMAYFTEVEYTNHPIK